MHVLALLAGSRSALGSAAAVADTVGNVVVGLLWSGTELVFRLWLTTVSASSGLVGVTP